MVEYCHTISSTSASPLNEYQDAEFVAWLATAMHPDQAELWWTPAQHLLKVPLPLLVAATWADLVTDQCDDRNHLFQRFQCIWKRKEPRTKYLDWSPNLVLSALSTKFQIALDYRCAAMIQISETATRDLLQAEAVHSRTKSRRKRVVSQTPSGDSVKSDDAVVGERTVRVSNKNREESSSAAAVAGLNHALVESPTPIVDSVHGDNVDDGDRKLPACSMRKEENSTTSAVADMHFAQVESHTPPIDSGNSDNVDDSNKKSKECSRAAVVSDLNNLPMVRVVPEEVEKELRGVQVPPPIDALDAQQQIQHLESLLAEKEQQRTEERAAAQKQLQSETNKLLEQIQALQLRLYISETRLQSYEAALKQHIESVAENTATSPGHHVTSEVPPLYTRGLVSNIHISTYHSTSGYPPSPSGRKGIGVLNFT